MNPLLIKRQPRTLFLRLLLCPMFLAGALAVAQNNVPRAVPVDEAPPRALPVTDGSMPAPAPSRAQAVEDPRPAAPPVSNRPSGPDEDLYEYATLCFTQGDHNIAIKPLSDYVRLYPQGRHAAEAWFRLGECHHETGDRAQAKRAYNQVLTSHSKSESAGSAAYRLGAYAYADKNFLEAAAQFSTCARLTTNPAIKLPALYNSAIAYEQGGDAKRATAAYEQVAAVKPPNKYRETALGKMATAYLDQGRNQEALTAFNDLIDITKDEEILGDALLRSGLILNELGKTDEAVKNFKRVLSNTTVPREQRGMALFGIIQSAYLKKDYQTVISTYTSNATTLPPGDIHAKMLLLVGNAQKQLQSYRQAIETYLLLEKNHPDSPEAIDAGYQKLLSFYQLGNENIPEFALAFEELYRTSHPDHEYLTMSRIIRADWWFGKGDYLKASEAFTGINITQVPEKVLPSILYKKGFTEVEAGKNNEAITTLTNFLEKYPQDANVPAALAQRGIAQKNVRAFDKALTDFTLIIKNHGGHPALEMALYQSGFIKSETRDVAGMIADYELLLQKFPKTAAAAEASFNIGKGYFSLNDKESFGKALDPLRKSIELNREGYLDKSSQLLINCQWLREDVDGMAKEVDTYLDARKGARINPQGLTFLGVNYFNRGNYEASNRYLSLASTPDQPEATEAPVWNYLGMARIETGHYTGAIIAFDHYLSKTPTGQGHVLGLYGKAKGQLGAALFDEAQKSINDALTLIKTGKLKGQLQILDGDVFSARGDTFAGKGSMDAAKQQWAKALAQYVVVSQFFVDPEITPEAAWKAAEMFEKTDDVKQATAMRSLVKSKYPAFTPKVPAPAKAMPPPPVQEEPPAPDPPAAEIAPAEPVPAPESTSSNTATADSI
ncbi:tetratricopeptide repeat protein [Phragmitibacter flavus]|uniref:Tetratricopeptide repeat protein n=1 Tax=Phragmitibacter flavus TaxID=2576071 RepID=A0A5R8KJH3_9BACT|nr:tetratricopeptide repeat protein [Phragmitibacter flavus]TLD72085.1 tetratricopeptide repeat protein [Phragmitibacter flavus]